MSEENQMTEDNKKTIIAFIAGLLVGGLLVFIFIEPAPSAVTGVNDDSMKADDMSEDDEVMDDEMDDSDDNSSASTNDSSGTTGVASVSVQDQPAGSNVEFSNATFPTNDGWVGVRDYENDQLSGLLGVARWSKSEGLLPTSVTLLRPTVAGNSYAIVFYSESGDKVFSLANDVQMSSVMEVFEAE